MVMNLKKEFDPTFVVLSFVISFLGIYVAVGMAEQLRLSLIDDRNVHGSEVKISRRKKHLLYLAFCAIGVGGIAIWGSFYVSLYSLHLRDENGRDHQHSSNKGVQMITFFMILILEIVAITSATYDDMFSKTKLAIINEFIADSKSLSMKEIRNITLKKLLVTLATTKLTRIVASGFLSGCGVLLMIYLGLYGMVFDGKIKYDIGWTTFAVIISLSCSIAGYWIFFRLLSIFPDQEWLRTSVAFVGSIAASFSNYLAILSAEFQSISSGEQELPHQRVTGMSQDAWDRSTSFYVTFVTANVMLWIVVMYILITARSMIHRQSHFFQQAENIVYKVAEENGLPLPLARQRMNQQKNADNDDNDKVHDLPNHHHHHHSHVHGHHGHSSSVTLKMMVEQYVNRRYANEMTNNARSNVAPNNINSSNIHSSSNNSANSKSEFPDPSTLYDRLKQENMSFSEYLCHLIYLLSCCRWHNLVVAVGWEFCPEMFENSTASRQSRDTTVTDNSNNANSTFSSHTVMHFKNSPIMYDDESTLDEAKPHPKPQYQNQQPESFIDLEDQQIYSVVGHENSEPCSNKLNDSSSRKYKGELLYSVRNSDNNGSENSSDDNKDAPFDENASMEGEDKMMGVSLKSESNLKYNYSSSDSKKSSRRLSQGNSNSNMFSSVKIAPMEA